MKENVYSFGDRGFLNGILSIPAAVRELPAVIILNSGLIPRIGPSRLYVKLARRLTASGAAAFRFDFSGIGNSSVRTDALPFAKSSVLEVQAAMDLLEKVTGARRFVLAGICSGADAAVETALADQRVAGLIPIDVYSVTSRGHQLALYKQRMRSLRSWGKLLTGKSDIVEKALAGKPAVQESPPEPVFENAVAGTVNTKTLDEITSDLTNLLRRQVRMLLVYASDSAANYNYEKHFSNALKSFMGKDFLTVLQQDADHGFTLLDAQQQLIGEVTEWMEKAFCGNTGLEGK